MTWAPGPLKCPSWIEREERFLMSWSARGLDCASAATDAHIKTTRTKRFVRAKVFVMETMYAGNCGLVPGRDQSKISTADAITVVHSPRLSPTADWVTFAVRTILLEIR